MKHISVFVGTLLCLLLVACNGTVGAFPHKTNPPPFDYGDGEELRSRMHQLAFALQRLDSSLATEYIEPVPSQQPVFQRSVADNLRDIERIGEGLQHGDLNSNHPFLLEDMERFLDDVRRAQKDVLRGRYYMAGRIAGACVSCHVANY